MPSRMLPRGADRFFGHALGASQQATLRAVVCHIPTTELADSRAGVWDPINGAPVQGSAVDEPLAVTYRVVTVPARIRWDDTEMSDGAKGVGIIKIGQCAVFVSRGYESWIVATQGDERAFLTVDGKTMKVMEGPMRQGFSLAGESIFILTQYSLTGGMNGDGAGGIG